MITVFDGYVCQSSGCGGLLWLQLQCTAEGSFGQIRKSPGLLSSTQKVMSIRRLGSGFDGIIESGIGRYRTAMRQLNSTLRDETARVVGVGRSESH